MIIHVVQRGDSLYSIGRQYGVSPQVLINQNQIENPQGLVLGQALVIPVESFAYQIRRGDSLYSIAQRYGVTVDDILRINPLITDPNSLRVGQIIQIPTESTQKRSIDVNGYAFPNIREITLRSSLPYLTFLSIFSYQVRADGSLTTINDEPLIAQARAARVAPMMVITNILEGGSFNSDLAHTILTNMQVQNTLVQNILSTLRTKNYYGLDIDFEYIYPADREAYNNFIRRITSELHAQGYIVTTALAPKVSATQPGLLYEAHDYAVHGELVDHVILMTYEWGYTYGPAQAVAPINQVERVLQYAVTAIPPEKILMGMPNYGYDWTLPFVQGTAARTLTNIGAINLASSVGAAIQYDERSQAPFFRYYAQNGQQHEVWFDDARSIQARLQLIDEYNLGGVSYWTINSFFNQQFLVLSSMYDINKLL